MQVKSRNPHQRSRQLIEQSRELIRATQELKKELRKQQEIALRLRERFGQAHRPAAVRLLARLS